MEKKLARATDAPILTLHEKQEKKSIVSQLLSTIIGKTTLDFTIFLERKVVTIIINIFLLYIDFRSKTGLKLAHKGNCEGDSAYTGWYDFVAKITKIESFVANIQKWSPHTRITDEPLL